MNQYYRQKDPSEALLLKAMEYDRLGDVYNAVKLYKRVIKMAPDWSAPFSFLSRIYKVRKEWQTSLHYSQKAVEHNPFDEQSWKHLGLAATALRKWEVAKDAWRQLGYQLLASKAMPALSPELITVRLNPKEHPEIVIAQRVDPVRARIISIPQPSSMRGYRDLILIDSEPSGHHYLDGQRYPIFDELQYIRPSLNYTFSVILNTLERSDIDLLQQLCLKSSIGFDNWTKAYRLAASGTDILDNNYIEDELPQQYVVALAAESDKEVINVLENWRVIALKQYEQLKRY